MRCRGRSLGPLAFREDSSWSDRDHFRLLPTILDTVISLGLNSRMSCCWRGLACSPEGRHCSTRPLQNSVSGRSPTTCETSGICQILKTQAGFLCCLPPSAHLLSGLSQTSKGRNFSFPRRQPERMRLE